MSTAQTVNQKICPHPNTLTNATLIAIKQDKPILLDYYLYSKQKKCKLVKTQENDTILYKTNDEYTSPLQKLFKIDNSNVDGDKGDMLAISQNSVYILSANIL